MNDLERYFDRNTGRLIHKWKHYFEIYDRHFARFRGRAPVVVEFGVSQGGSLQMWRDYLGAGTRYFGVDINPNCKQFEEEGVRVFIGDQGDRAFLRSVAREVPAIDILIDDGGHTMRQQIHTFEELFPQVAPDGVYLCEDVHTSYWQKWGGGYRRRGSFIEYAKGLVDGLNAWHSEDKAHFDVTPFTRTAHSMHFYDSVVVVEKRPMQPPSHERRGQALFADYVEPKQSHLERIKRSLGKP